VCLVLGRSAGWRHLKTAFSVHGWCVMCLLCLCRRDEAIDDSQVYKQQMAQMGGGGMVDIQKAFQGEKQALELVRNMTSCLCNLSAACMLNWSCATLSALVHAARIDAITRWLSAIVQS